MTYRFIPAKELFWRPSNQMGVLNTNLGEQLQIADFSARLWRLRPGQASTKHRHRKETELYVLLEGKGKIRVDGDLIDFEPMSALVVDPDIVRQILNNTDSDQLWLIVGAPPEIANTLEMSDDEIAYRYPDGMRALPPELE